MKDQDKSDPSARRLARNELQRQIDENLKRVYSDQLNEALPERFTSLLAQLKAGDTPGRGGNDEGKA